MKNWFSLILLTFMLFSCRKQGCRDPLATNYDAKASNQFPCCCTYEGKCTFWFDQATSDSLINNNVDTLFIWLQNDIAGIIPTTNWVEAEPQCGSEQGATITLDMSSSSKLGMDCRVKASGGGQYWQLNIGFAGGLCKIEELVW